MNLSDFFIIVALVHFPFIYIIAMCIVGYFLCIIEKYHLKKKGKKNALEGYNTLHSSN